MPTHIIEADGQKLIFGLDWEVLDGDRKEAKEAQQKAREQRAVLQVRHQSGHTIVYGFLSKEALPDKAGKKALVSAGVLFATVPEIAENAIWVWLDSETQTARMLVLENGVPTSAEFVGAIGEVNSRLDRMQRESGKSFTMYGNHTQAYPDIIGMSLEDMVECGNLQQATMTAAKHGSGPVLVLLLLGVVLAGGGFGFVEYQKKKERERLEELRRKQVDPVKVYRESVEKALPGAGVPSSKAGPHFLSAWRQQETLIGGWILKTVECVPESCTFTWTNAGGNNRSLHDALGATHTLNFSADGQEIKYTVLHQGTPPMLDITALPKAADFMLETGSFLQDVRLAGASTSMEAPRIFAEPSGVNVSSVPDLIRHGSLSVGGRVSNLDEILKRLPDNVTLKKITVTIPQSEPKFQLEGYYYVKN